MTINKTEDSRADRIEARLQALEERLNDAGTR